jgi:hypothetical protein
MATWSNFVIRWLKPFFHCLKRLIRQTGVG